MKPTCECGKTAQVRVDASAPIAGDGKSCTRNMIKALGEDRDIQRRRFRGFWAADGWGGKENVGRKEERRATNHLFGPNNHAIEHVLADFELTCEFEHSDNNFVRSQYKVLLRSQTPDRRGCSVSDKMRPQDIFFFNISYRQLHWTTELTVVQHGLHGATPDPG